MNWQVLIIYFLTLVSLIGTIGALVVISNNINYGLKPRGLFLLISFVAMNILLVILCVEDLRNFFIYNWWDSLIVILGIVIAPIGYIYNSIRLMNAY